ncbi:MAG: PAS domain-containing sensor histidine kinase [Woeseiaceae bacterium]
MSRSSHLFSMQRRRSWWPLFFVTVLISIVGCACAFWWQSSLGIAGAVVATSGGAWLPALTFFATTLLAMTWVIRSGSLKSVVTAELPSTLRHTAELLTTILDHAPAMVFVKDVNTRKYVSVNREVTDATGFSEAHFLGKTDGELFSEELAALFVGDDERMLETPGTAVNEREEVFYCKDGSTLLLRTRKVVVRDMTGKAHFLLGISNNITDERKAMEALRRSEQRYQAVIESAELGILTLDGKGQVLSANPSATEILGYESVDMIGESYLKFVSQDGQAQSKEVFATLLASMRADDLRSRELVAVRKNGERFPVWRSMTLLTDGEDIVFAVMFRDMTAEKAAETKLIESRLVAEKANQAKSDFLATMSHELRTPLNAIIGFSELLGIAEAREESADVMMYADRIGEAGQHLLALINDVLDLSKIEAGKATLDVVDTDLVVFFRSTRNTVQDLVEAQGNVFEMRLGQFPPKVPTDPTKLRQILLNLLGNASKFTSNGRVTLDVKIERDADRDMLVMQVADTGVGIPEEKLDHVMNAFAQADSSMTRNFGGTGLGLAITQRNCDLMGGDIRVESTLGEGSVFTARVAVPPPMHAITERVDAD